MNEADSRESSRSRWITHISISLAVIAALVVLVFIGFVVTVYVVTEKYESLHEAVKKRDAFAVRCLLLRGADVNAKNKQGQTPLHRARRADVAKLLIARRADVHAKDFRGMTPLHWAAFYGHTEVARLLIDRGADVNAKNKYGKTPLHGAAENGHTEVARLLIDRGADVNAEGEK